MKLGIDVTWMGAQPAGVGTMVREVVEELLRRPGVELVLFARPGWTSEWPKATVVEVPGAGPLRHLVLAIQLRRAGIDALWQVGDWLPLFLPGQLVAIQTVHDVLGLDHPEWFPQRGLSSWWSNTIRVRYALRRATIVHAISAWTAKALERHVPQVAGKTIVAYQGVQVEASVEPLPGTISRPYLLVLGTIEPRKQLRAVCDAFALFAAQYEEPHLVIAGGVGWRAEASLSAIRDVERAFSGRVHRLGYVSDAQKAMLLREAGAVVCLSAAEGFGRPVVEAMSVGVPSIVAANSALQEVAEDAAILVRPHDTQKVARAMWRALYHDTLRERLAPLMAERVKRFSTKAMVTSVLEAQTKHASQEARA